MDIRSSWRYHKIAASDLLGICDGDRVIKAFGLILALVLSQNLTRADTVKTNDGRTFTGIITKDDESELVIDSVIHGIRAKVTLHTGEVASKVKEPLPEGFFNAPIPSTQQSVLVQAAPTSRDLDSASKTVIQQLLDEIKVHHEDLAGLRRTLAKTSPKTNWHRVRPGETLGDVMMRRDPEPNPDYSALRKQIKETEDLIAMKNKQVVDVRRGGAAGQSVVDAVLEANALASAERAEQAEAQKRQLTGFIKKYDTPEKAADFCVEDLKSQGIIKLGTRLGVGAIQGEKAQWALASGQWATAPLGVGIAAPGAPLPIGGPPRRPRAVGAQVSYTFTFITQAGLLREHEGYVLVANVDGFWEPWGYDIDGISAPPYNGRERYGQTK